MATTIVTKYGGDAPAASDIVRGELAVDTENGRLYTENAAGAVVELGSNPSGNITFGDNGKAIFGAGSDLEIYHDGTNSYVKDNGTGRLTIQSASDFLVANTDNTQNYIYAVESGAVNLYHSGSKKFETTATGIDITGTATAASFETDAGGTFTTAAGNDLNIVYPAGRSLFIKEGSETHVTVDNVGSVGIGTSSPAGLLNLHSASGDSNLFITTGNTAASTNIFFGDTDNSSVGRIVYDHGSNYMNFRTNGSDAMRIDANGNVGIGVVPPSSQVSYIRNVQIQGLQAYGHTSINDWGGFFINSYIDAAGLRKYISSSQYAFNLHFDNTGAFILYNAPNTNSAGDTVPFVDRFRISSDGQLTSSVAGGVFETRSDGGGFHYKQLLDVATAGALFTGRSNRGDLASIALYQTATSADGGYIKFNTSNSGSTTPTEKARITQEGNLLVGKTSSGISNSGFEVGQSGQINVTQAGAVVGRFNRKTSDGSILELQKDGATVGSIAASTNLNIGSGGTRIWFRDGTKALRPVSTEVGNGSDGIINIGEVGGRFKDLYLSGGAYLGGTGAANKLEDYEEGTFTPTVIGSTTAGTATYSHQKGLYTKIGRAVTVQIYLNWSSGTGAGNLKISNLPFTQFSSSGYYASAAIGEYSNISGTAGHTLCGIGLPSTVDMQFSENDFNSAPTVTTYDAAGYIILTMTYMTD